MFFIIESDFDEVVQHVVEREDQNYSSSDLSSAEEDFLEQPVTLQEVVPQFVAAPVDSVTESVVPGPSSAVPGPSSALVENLPVAKRTSQDVREVL